MDSIILRRTQLPALLGLSLATIDRMRAAGNFPPCVRVGVHAVGFIKADLMAWVATRKEAIK